MRAVTTLFALLLCLGSPGCKRSRPAVETRPQAQKKPGAVPAKSSSASKILKPVKGKFNVAFVYVGPIGDGGWTYAHDVGRKHAAKTLGIHTAYVENVSEGAEAEQVIRGLARKGFDLVVATSFGYMDAVQAVASEFPRCKFLHISGHKNNERNFGNIFGAMESMKYLAGMIAGARAMADGKTRLGYIAPFPIPEVVRLGNALMLGIGQTCPGCTLEIRWINSWFDPTKEREAAESLLKQGAHVVITGADTPGPIIAAKDNKKWAIGYDSENACAVAPAHCLTTPYWDWGTAYVDVFRRIQAGTWKGNQEYHDVSKGIVGLYGFMKGQTVPAGVPPSVVPRVRALLARMQTGQHTRFDVFGGPLVDNKGKQVLARGSLMTQKDLEGVKGCTVCMNWLAKGIIGELPARK